MCQMKLIEASVSMVGCPITYSDLFASEVVFLLGFFFKQQATQGMDLCFDDRLSIVYAAPG